MFPLIQTGNKLYLSCLPHMTYITHAFTVNKTDSVMAATVCDE